MPITSSFSIERDFSEIVLLLYESSFSKKGSWRKINISQFQNNREDSLFKIYQETAAGKNSEANSNSFDTHIYREMSTEEKKQLGLETVKKKFNSLFMFGSGKQDS